MWRGVGGGGGDGGDGGRHHVAPVPTAHSAVLEIEIGEETALECYVYSDPTDSLPDEILLVLGDTGVRICELTTGEEVNAWVWAAISGWFQNKQRPESSEQTNTEDELALKRSAAGSTLDSATGSNNNPGSNAEDGGEVELMDMFVMEVRGLGVFSFECEDSEVMARAFAAVRARAAGASRTGNVYGA